ncbi:MAG: nitronate monooxygenase [Gemmatimonadetes bacterium]|nr:nitronate monooxygenase [Gemmatimonadota bacterium]
MYPCSNPELVAAASEAGAIGIVQPISLTYVHGHPFREGLQLIRSLTSAPIGMNALIEASSAAYRRRMERWIDVALEEGIRFFVTSLGKPDWVVRKVHAVGGKVYHDVTERKWAEKGVEAGVDGLIAVNQRAGGHPGRLSAGELLDEVGDFGLPVVCAGGVGSEDDFAAALGMGYAGVQMGTRFIATTECHASEAYKRAIVEADEVDIVWTERITGVPVAVIRTPYVDAMGTRAGPLARRLLRWKRTKHWMRTWYALSSLRRLKRSSLREATVGEYWQAGKSVSGITTIEPAGEVVRRLARGAAGLVNKRPGET